jgi:hypothetical protein
VSFCTLLGFHGFRLSLLESMTGTTGLEPATSAVTTLIAPTSSALTTSAQNPCPYSEDELPQDEPKMTV